MSNQSLCYNFATRSKVKTKNFNHYEKPLIQKQEVKNSFNM